MRIVRHPNIVELKAFYYSNGDRVRETDTLMGVQTALMAAQKDEVYLNLVLEFVPETVYRASRHFNKIKTTMPILEVKLYIYQLFRSLAYIHSQGICHRDIKPQNLFLIHDHVKVAEGLGCKALRVTRPEELPTAFEEAEKLMA